MVVLASISYELPNLEMVLIRLEVISKLGCYSFLGRGEDKMESEALPIY